MAIILRILGLDSGRYHAWRRAENACELTDRSSCPRTNPGQLTATEVATIKDMVLSPECRHMPLGTLARYAQRMGKVFASASTWAKLVRDHGWRRPRQRVHPTKPTIGVRASRPNQIWHIDTSVIRLIDGTKVYLQAVVDNFSRKILAWVVAEHFDPSSTCQVLLAAVSATRPPRRVVARKPRPAMTSRTHLVSARPGVRLQSVRRPGRARPVRSRRETRD